MGRLLRRGDKEEWGESYLIPNPKSKICGTQSPHAAGIDEVQAGFAVRRRSTLHFQHNGDRNPKSYWRLIPLLEASGEIQMAIDRWLLQQHRQGKHPPTLRFYTWSPAAISVGYHQHHYPEHWRELTWQGKPIDLVRRPTGGRAVLHQGDLTYMVVASSIPGRRTEVYQKICEFLVHGWRSLGIELRYGSAGRGYIHNPNCFGTATNADLVAPDGRKLIGSAQLRQGNAILQHGSILLNPNRQLFRQVFGDSAPEPVNLPIQLTETRASQKVVVQALTEAASQCFGIELVTQPLSEIELQEIYCANVSDRARHPTLNSG